MTATPPECPVHGPMKFRPPGAVDPADPAFWTCNGWDGEGCPACDIGADDDGTPWPVQTIGPPPPSDTNSPPAAPAP